MAYSDSKDLFPFVGSDADTDILLFFTDNKGEPKKLNIRRCIEGDTAFTGNALGYSGDDLEDFITACPKAPSAPIHFTWNKNLEIEGNFNRTNGIQFAYQNIYVDGFVTAMSPLSEVAYPPTIQNIGASPLSAVTIENECILQIPNQGPEIDRVRILFREGNFGAFKIIDEISNKIDINIGDFEFINDEDVLGYYTFRNDSVYGIAPAAQTSKNFDNLPRKAKAQSVSGNRLMYGNYVEGFNPITVAAAGEVIFKGVDQSEALSSSGTQINSINVFADKERDGGTKGESIGFSIDYGTEPIAPGVYTLSIDMTPERNFHLFDAKAYHPSKNITFNGASDFEFDGIELEDNDAGGPFPINNVADGDFQVSSTDETKMLHGYDPDQNGLFPLTWNSFNSEAITTSIGTTAANPLIIPGSRIKIEISFEIISEDSLDPDVLATAIENIISSGDPNSAYVSLISFSGEDLSGFDFEQSSLNSYSGVATVVESSLPLESRQSFSANSSAADCVSWVPLNASLNIPGAPAGFFIVKNANLLVDVVPVNTSSLSASSSLFATGDNPQTSTFRHYVFRPRVISSAEVLTCIPEPVNGIGSGDAIYDAEQDDYEWSTTSQMPFRIRGSVGVAAIYNNGSNDWSFHGGPHRLAEITPGEKTLNWEWPKVERRKVDGSFITNPNFPKLSASFDRDDNELSFDYFNGTELYDTYKSTPIAIDKWHVFNYEDISTGDWKENFTYELSFISGGETINQTHKPLNTIPWVYGVSFAWEGFLAGFEGQDTLIPEGPQNVGNSFYASMIDGAAGVGSRVDASGYSSIADDEVFYPYAVGDIADNSLNPSDYSGAPKPVSNRRGSVWNTTLMGVHENFKFIQSDAANGDTGAYITPASPTDQEIFAAPLQDLGSYLDVGVEGSSISSFKTRDYHDFGIVYFDKRGRAGSVNPLPSVYVPGYSNSERGIDEKGAVVVQYRIVHLPPDWADSYKIVYAGAANTERFIQYSAGGAYVDKSSTVSVPDKIYVSLNYLQSNKASYARSYGAVDQDTGETTLYRFTPGDKLRVISYYSDNETINYAPKSYEFDVVGVEEVSSEQINPFVDDDGILSETLPATGSFVVLRDNREASGFTAAEVQIEADKWGDRCIFEIVTPRKSRDDEQKVFYETPFGGGIIIENGRRVHQYGTINIDQGDVFFRKVPVNLRDYDDDSASFTDIISADEANETSVSRFRSYFLESSSVSDTYRSNAKSFGRPHFVIDGYRERINDTAIIFSDATNQESYNLFYTSFSPLAKNYFDLPAKYGDIDYMADAGDQIYVAQNSKIGKIQVNKSLTSTAAGSDTLNLSREVLNSPRFFLEDVGTDGHPESVTWDNSKLYFVDQGRGAVVSAGEDGMKFLSSAGMEKFFKRLLAKYKEDSRIVTGFNPFTEELIVSVMKNSVKNSTVNFVEGSDLSRLNPNTLSYDVSTGDWRTAYTFYSTEYASLGDRMLSFKNTFNRGGNSVIWSHDTGAKNTFYGQIYPSAFTSVFVNNANMTKDFKSISIDGTSPWTIDLVTTNESSSLTSFKDYEGTFYTEIGRSEKTSSKNNIKSIGNIDTINVIDDSTYELCFKRDITQYHITLTTMSEFKISEVMFVDRGGQVGILSQFISSGQANPCHPIEISDKYKLIVKFQRPLGGQDQTAFLNFSGRDAIVKSEPKVFGDSLRDKFLKVTATASPGRNKIKTELYSLNIDYIESKLDSSR